MKKIHNLLAVFDFIRYVLLFPTLAIMAIALAVVILTNPEQVIGFINNLFGSLPH